MVTLFDLTDGAEPVPPLGTPPETPSWRQRSFDDLGVPLHEATFCIFDLETTGGSAATDAITEIGAVKVRGGEVLGTFQTLVNPGRAIPPTITMLTGITDQQVVRAPTIAEVLPAFLEFVGGAVLVGHNLRFDTSFVDAAVRRHGGPLLGNQRIDTLALARRLLVDEVRSFKLGELARSLRLAHQPSHRALDDAWATTDLLHELIGRATGWGVKGLDDLVALPTVAGHPQARKLKLTTDLPRRPGVYFFLDAAGTVLYVGKATDLRARVRSYFSSDRRKKVAQLLRETTRIEHRVCVNTLEAAVVELRLIRSHQPRFNRQGRRERKPVWVRLTDERYPRLSIVRAEPPADVASIGPLTSSKSAQAVVEAVQSALPIRRCTTKIPYRRRAGDPPPSTAGRCASAQLGVSLCPCAGDLDERAYGEVVAQVARSFNTSPDLVLVPLSRRMTMLAAEDRFEDAAAARDRARAFTEAIRRSRRAAMLVGVERLVLEHDGSTTVEIGGRGVRPESLDEALCVASWLDRHADRLRLVTSEGELSSPLPRLPDFSPAGR
ncbi:MAG: DEDD exonuclease domain-containing protein [Acidimicrobiales bacterium]